MARQRTVHELWGSYQEIMLANIHDDGLIEFLQDAFYAGSYSTLTACLPREGESKTETAFVVDHLLKEVGFFMAEKLGMTPVDKGAPDA